MGCGTSAVSDSLNNNFHPTVAPLSSSSTLNQQSNSNRIPKGGRQIDTNEIIENFLLIWLDAEIDKSKEDYQNSIKHLRRTVNTVETFQDTEECIDCTSKLQDKKVFLIISGALCQTVVPRIHNMDQVHSIYVFYGKQENYIEWAKDWSKIKGIYTEITAICDSARQSARQCDEDSVVIAGMSSLNRIEPSFIYTQPCTGKQTSEYNNQLGRVYFYMAEHSKALTFLNKGLEMRKTILPPNDPDLAKSYDNIGLVYNNMGEYSKAFSSYEQSLGIQKIVLPSNHPDLAASYNNIGSAYNNMGEYSKALSYYEKAQEIWQKSFPSSHPHIVLVEKNIENIKKKL
ncbi:unnamed protein product [Rotaria sordida]|uniref:Uncharacterized protein n=1 Tax=Rotaria sordida TaxID=392033 RepID=A0A815EWV0_9BILA|nr:unnamed protein product [Rotaria sordida]CAF3975700.1 unnamed protein product [Rotaria sordida]